LKLIDYVLIITTGLVALGIVLFSLMAIARGEPLPLPRPPGPGGSCPHGYTTSGSYCVPSQGAQDAVAKSPGGTCPFGWSSRTGLREVGRSCSSTSP
jgi:hypothetical protein